jgi:hypothetical protein
MASNMSRMLFRSRLTRTRTEERVGGIVNPCRLARSHAVITTDRQDSVRNTYRRWFSAQFISRYSGTQVLRYSALSTRVVRRCCVLRSHLCRERRRASATPTGEFSRVC